MLGSENCGAISKVYAVEGQCFVLAPSALVDETVLELTGDDENSDEELFNLGGGHTMIFGPDGRSLAPVIPEKEEGIVYADIDREMISMAKIAYDPIGHYSRPDVARLLLNKNPANCVECLDQEDNNAAYTESNLSATELDEV